MKLPKFDAMMRRRIFMAFFGVMLCSFAVGFFRLSDFGTDPYQCLAAGLSNVIPIGFGNTLTALNCVLLVEVFFLNKRYLGIATLFSVFLTGYVVEFSEWVLGLTGIEMTLVVRIIYLAIGVVLMCIASSFYITSNLGVSSYDAQALMIGDTGKLQFRFARIGTDLICVLVGFALDATVGVGTLVTAFFMGPLIDLFNRKLARPFLNRPVR
ncbi:MAG: hypothetical protein IJC56_11230 [Clostridia bacterium]|nr:hypothetical protein [Clostridia bacterium]